MDTRVTRIGDSYTSFDRGIFEFSCEYYNRFLLFLNIRSYNCGARSV